MTIKGTSHLHQRLTILSSWYSFYPQLLKYKSLVFNLWYLIQLRRIRCWLLPSEDCEIIHHDILLLDERLHNSPFVAPRAEYHNYHS